MEETFLLVEHKKQATYGLLSAIEALMRAFKEELLIEERLRSEVEDKERDIEEMQEHIDTLVASSKHKK